MPPMRVQSFIYPGKIALFLNFGPISGLGFLRKASGGMSSRMFKISFRPQIMLFFRGDLALLMETSGGMQIAFLYRLG